MNRKNLTKGLIGGLAAGMVAAWAANGFYNLARQNESERAMWPYLVGAGAGAAYATVIEWRKVPPAARIPLGAAIWLGEPTKAVPEASAGRDLPEKAQNLAARLASKGLKKVAQKALLA